MTFRKPGVRLKLVFRNCGLLALVQNKTPLLTRRDLAVRWQCSVETIKRREACGIVQPLRLGRTVRYREADIERIEAQAAAQEGGAR